MRSENIFFWIPFCIALGPGAARADSPQEVLLETSDTSDRLIEKEEGPTLWGQPLLSPPVEAHYMDPRVEPLLLVRTLLVTTQKSRIEIIDSTGTPIELSSASMDTSQFGHREGFVLENVELGIAGRFNRSGVYYQAKVDFVPKEKDGNRSDEYLKDAYAGWNRYRLVDLRIGRMKIPFSRSELTSTGDQTFVYKPAFTARLTPPTRLLGVALELMDPFAVFRLRGGVFNSASPVVQQISESSKLLYVGRGELNLAGLVRAFGLRPGDLELRLSGALAWVKENFDPETEHRFLSLAGHAHFWRFTLETEYVVKDHYVRTLNPETLSEILLGQRGSGWHVDLAAELWPGVLDVMGRLELMDGSDAINGLDPGLSMDDVIPQKKRWITAGLIFHVFERGILSANYVHRQELEGYSFKNDVFLLMAQFEL